MERLIQIRIGVAKNPKQCGRDCEHLVDVDMCHWFGELAYASTTSKRPLRHDRCIAAEVGQSARSGS